MNAPPSPSELAAVSEQLGRPARGVRAVMARCPAGHPAVVETEPRLPDGSPFPTLYYLTCPQLSAEIGRWESGGVMREWNERLAAEPRLAAAYHRAHEDYLARRERIASVPEITGVSAGGMPDRVKCLHALLAHTLAVGAGINPVGDALAEALWPWWRTGPCARS